MKPIRWLLDERPDILVATGAVLFAASIVAIVLLRSAAP